MVATNVGNMYTPSVYGGLVSYLVSGYKLFIECVQEFLDALHLYKSPLHSHSRSLTLPSGCHAIAIRIH